MTNGELPVRTLRSARLPGIALPRVLTLCSALQGEALPLPPAALAERLDISPTSSALKQTLAAARLFGLVEARRGEITLTARGAAALQPSVPGLRARREAVQDSGLGPLIRAMQGEPATLATVERRMRETGVVAASRTRVLGRVLLDSARAAGLVAGGRFMTPDDASPSPSLLEEAMTPPAPTRSEEAPRESAAPAPPVVGVMELRLSEQDRALVHRLIAALEAHAGGPARDT